MKKIKILAVALICFGASTAQQSQVDFDNPKGLKMETDYSSNNPEIRDILNFEGIDYLKLKFSDDALKGKSYKLSVKEIWDGEVRSESVVLDSKTMGVKQFERINDSVFSMKVISKLTSDNQLKMTFSFPRFSVTKKYDAIKSDDYSLRNLADESDLEIDYNKSFHLLAYILPYEREDGSKSWCQVGASGDDIEKWGKEFGIKHYLIFEMIFE